jgi:hypothetical protein
MQKILFHYEDKDFSKEEERKAFSRKVGDVVEQMIELLESYPPKVGETTIDVARSLIEQGRGLRDAPIRATGFVTSSSQMSAEKDRIEREYRQSAENVVEKAEEVISHIDEVNSG